MSKAFINEDSGQDDAADDLADDDGADDEAANGGAQFASSKNYITPAGMAALKSEMHALMIGERPKLVETIAWAAGNGDRSENADYIYGKRRLREIDKRVRFLQKRIDRAEIVDPTMQKGDKVLFGATVTVRDEDGEEKNYSIVGIDETNAKAGMVSWVSPIGQALLQAKKGDVVALKTPRGEEELEIIAVAYRALN